MVEPCRVLSLIVDTMTGCFINTATMPDLNMKIRDSVNRFVMLVKVLELRWDELVSLRLGRRNK